MPQSVTFSVDDAVVQEWDTVIVTGNITIGSSGTSFLCDASGGALTVTLPPASEQRDRMITIKKTDSSGNAITIDGNGSDLIDDTLTKIITVQYTSITIVSDGSDWWIQ